MAAGSFRRAPPSAPGACAMTCAHQKEKARHLDSAGLPEANSSTAGELQRVTERCFPEIHFRPGTPNLHLRNIMNIFGNRDRLVHFVTLDLETLEQVGMAVAVHH